MSSFLDTEITPDILEDIYTKQYRLQEFMHEKRNLEMPPALECNRVTHAQTLAAMYFSTCLNLEWAELLEAYESYANASEVDLDKRETLRLHALEECIDVFHFSLGVFIFSGYKPENVRKLSHFRLYDMSPQTFAEFIGDTSLAVARVIAELPYKTWKNSQDYKEIDTEYQKLLENSMSLIYNNILDFIVTKLDSSYEEFIQAYNRKNSTNFSRQTDKSLGYIS